MDELGEKLGQERLIATTKEDLPPLKEGFCRLVHITNPRMVDGILATGLNYEKQGMISSTVRIYNKADDVKFGSDDWRFSAPGLKTIVMDVPATELRLHNDVTRSPGIIPAEYIVGVVDNKD